MPGMPELSSIIENDMRLVVKKILVAEWIIMVAMFVLVIIGVIIGFTNPVYFEEAYTREDGLVENLTAIALFAAAVIVIVKLWRARGESTLRTACHVIFALMLIFGAGEEISWGQRIFGWESGEFFLEHNDQKETNLHNLIVNDTKINKFVFGQILTGFLAIYFLVLPFAFRGMKRVRAVVNRMGIPVPRVYQSLLFAVAYSMTLIIPAGRKWELGEMALAAVIVVVVINSYNNMGIAPGRKRHQAR